MNNMLKFYIILILSLHFLNTNAVFDWCFKTDISNVNIKTTPMKYCIDTDISTNCRWNVILSIKSTCDDTYHIYNEKNIKKEWLILKNRPIYYDSFILRNFTQENKVNDDQTNYVRKLVNIDEPNDIIYLKLTSTVTHMEIIWLVLLIIMIWGIISIFVRKKNKHKTK